ncbi:hypothetical protein GCM10009789_38140 [Kribbella sancticallisti]|uniref:Uncharacterized protein n=1 Tax=Kribbella sancticallisti TaxID=460087 RepID=A0ABN2DMI1_9ACTN
MVVAGVVLVLLLVLMLAGVGGEHGPRRHSGLGSAQAGAVVTTSDFSEPASGTRSWR